MEQILKVVGEKLKELEGAVSVRDWEIKQLREELEQTKKALDEANAIIDSMDGTPVKAGMDGEENDW